MIGWIFWIAVAALLLVLVRRPLPIALSLLGGALCAIWGTDVGGYGTDAFGRVIFVHPSALLSNAHGSLHRFIYNLIAGLAFFLFLAALPKLFRHLDWMPGRLEPPKN